MTERQVTTLPSMALRKPPVVPADTAPEVWRRADMEEAAVRRAHPDMADDGVFYELVRRRYGEDLAAAASPDKAPRTT
jgi:hypothetical protein